MTAQQHRTMRLVSLCTAVITLVVYLGTLTQVHTFDALSYILDVSRKPWQQLFHPHHLAYGPLGALIASLSQTDPATALQVANAIAGSIGSGLLCATVYRRWFRVDVALLAAFSCAFSYAYWYYAVEVEVYTLATLCIIAVLWLAMDPAPARVRWRVGLAVALAGAVLFHQTNAVARSACWRACTPRLADCGGWWGSNCRIGIRMGHGHRQRLYDILGRTSMAV